jgi:hypothetical protein
MTTTKEDGRLVSYSMVSRMVPVLRIAALKQSDFGFRHSGHFVFSQKALFRTNKSSGRAKRTRVPRHYLTFKVYSTATNTTMAEQTRELNDRLREDDPELIRLDITAKSLSLFDDWRKRDFFHALGHK